MSSHSRGLQSVRKVAAPPINIVPTEPVKLLQISDGFAIVGADISKKPIKISANGIPFFEPLHRHGG